MRIEYICHACLLIETEDLRIVTDPWLLGTAYCGQWHLFPKPVNSEKLDDIDTVLISHGHEDHLNEESLRLLNKDANVYYPYSFFGGAKEYIEEMGFKNVIEATTLKRYKLSEKTYVTFIINSHDSLMVIESGGKVLVNVNDALHSYPETVIAHYLEEIGRRWSKIDYVFCGFGGASYFPNTMHLSGKDDWEIGLVREQLFAHNFCRIVNSLKPKVAIPFAADFVLLDEEQKWINQARFPRSKLSDYYAKHFASDQNESKIIDMYSGDTLSDLTFEPSSPYRDEMIDGELGHLVNGEFSDSIKKMRQINFISETEAETLIDKVRANIAQRSTLFSTEKLKRLSFSLEIKDIEKKNFFNIYMIDGVLRIERNDRPSNDSLLTMKLSSEVLRYSISTDWGADVISIGYGAEIEISDNRASEVDLESVCMNLLACYPTIRDLRKSPLRTMKFLLLNPPSFTTSIRKLKRFNLESENFDRKTWLLDGADEIRKKYNLPKLSDDFIPDRP